MIPMVSASLVRLHLRIRGRVQGVGYRYFAVQKAHDLALTGWVRNASDGNVECEIQGPKEKVEELVIQLKRNHPWARVEEMLEENIPAKNGEKGFEVRY